MQRLLHASPFALLLLLCSSIAVSGEWTMELSVHGERLQGTPLAWTSKSVDFLGRDGSWRTFAPHEAEDYRKLTDSFHPLTHGEVRAMLIGEFGAEYEVSGAGHYLVVHPAGQRSQWADRFDALYRSFVQYFAVRGLAISAPRFPLMAVVFPTRNDFTAYAARQGLSLPGGVLGYYSRISNRILLYDLTAEASGGAASENLATIIHEATHQTAFNTGVHNRFAAPPTWAVEGLATMFEAPGVYDSRRHTTIESRLNRGRLAAFRRYAGQRRTGEVLAELVASDRLFNLQPDAAYAHAWALTFYLSEQQPRQYGRYLATTAARPALSAYFAAERSRDFTAHFGDDFTMLEARLLRFYESIP